MRLQYILTDEQIADVLTKPLSSGKFTYFETSLAWQRMPPSLRGSVDESSIVSHFPSQPFDVFGVAP